MEDNLQPYDEQIMIPDNDIKIYSKRAVVAFTLLFSTIFGAVLLMQNLKDLGQKKQANMVLFLSILYTGISIFIVNIPERPNNFLTYLCNFIGAMILIEFIYKPCIPDEENYEKKTIWKPLIISILITIPFVLALIASL